MPSHPEPRQRSLFDRLFDRYFDLAVKYRWVTIGFWIVVLGLGCGFGFNFPKSVSINVKPPKGTTGYSAKQAFDSQYNDLANQETYLVYLSCGACNTSVNPNMYRYAETMIGAAASFKANYVKDNQTWWSYPNSTEYAAIKAKFISDSDPRTMLATMRVQFVHDTAQVAKFVAHMRDTIGGLGLDDGDYVGFVGAGTILADAVAESSHTVTEIDTIVLPLALSVLVYIVQSWRMVVIPLFNVATCLLSSFACMYGLTAYTTPAPSFVPSVMEALVLALSIDYSLFLLTRYRFEIMQNQREPRDAVKASLYHAGEVVFMSGMTLICCFIGMMGFPTQTVYMVGVGCTICLALALVINLTMTPALLLSFPNFFSTFQVLPFCTRSEGPAVEDPLVEPASPMRDPNPREKIEKSYFYQSTRRFIKWPYVLLTLLIPLALIAPAAVKVLDIKVSSSSDQISPRNSDSTAVMNRLRSSFPPGYMNPFYIVVESTNSAPNSIKSDAFFSKAALLVERLANQTSLQTGDITSIAYVEGLGGVTSWSEAQIALQTSDVYRDFFYQNIDADNTSTIFTVVTPFDPWGDDVAQFNDRVYEVFKSPDLDGDLNMYLCGAPIWMLDAKRKTYELFPYVILGTVLAIFLLISLMFRSAFIPLRYSFTLVFPLSFIFGFAVLIYQYGALDWLGWGALRNVNGMYWLTPIITFPICTGLALDYDIFLMCRVQEYRLEGYSNDASILRAAVETSGIITAAGVIMAIAFGGLLFSQTDTLNQIAWLLFSSVLFDTFIVRTVLVPAFMSLAGWLNWWPRKLEYENLKDEFGNPSRIHSGFLTPRVLQDIGGSVSVNSPEGAEYSVLSSSNADDEKMYTDTEDLGQDY